MGTKKYQGWRNFETWHVATWLEHDEHLSALVRQAPSYVELCRALRELEIVQTPDGVSYTDSALDVAALDELVRRRS